MSGRRLAMFPLSTVLYPHSDLPLHVFEPRYRTMMTDCLAADGTFGVVLIDRGSEVGGGDHRVAVGTVAHIRAASPQPDGRWVLLARGAQRIRVLDWHDDEPYPVASVEPLAEEEVEPEPEDLDRAAQRVRRVRALLSEMGTYPPLPADALDGSGPFEQVWRLCAATPINTFDRQRLLEAADPTIRLALLSELADELAEDMTRLLASRPEPGGTADG